MTGQIRIEDIDTRRGAGAIIASEQPEVSTGKKCNLLIIDDDPVFCRIVSKLCKLDGIAASFRTNLKDLDSIDLAQFSGAIIDINLGLASGVEVADYIQSIVPDMPLLMVSTSRYSAKIRGSDGLPFIHKSEGPQAIIDAALHTVRQRI
jgi:two-component SAPR family response regulator